MIEVETEINPDGSGNTVPDSHPNETILRVLSDMARLYGYDNLERSTRKRIDAATNRKLAFYAARVVCVPALTLRVLADEVMTHSKLMVLESGEHMEATPNLSTRATPVRPRPAIEEL